METTDSRLSIVIASSHTSVTSTHYALEQHSLHVTSAPDAATTIAHLKQIRPDILFLDDTIPGMDAFQLLEIINTHFPYIGIIMITDAVTDAFKAKCATAKADTWLAKPLSTETMLAAIEAVRLRQDVKVAPFKIVLIEDDSQLAETIAGVLTERGYLVDSFVTGTDAVEMAMHKTYDAVLSDYRLPGMNGIEVIRKIKTAQPDIVTLLMTAYGSMDVAIKAICEQVYDIIPKPFDPQMLLRLMRKALSHKTPKQCLPTAPAGGNTL